MKHAALALAWLLGLYLQQLQARLWPGWMYLALGLGAGTASVWVALRRTAPRSQALLSMVLVMALAWAYTGWRAQLKPALNARLNQVQEHTVQGVISDWVRVLPQGQGFTLRADARLNDAGVWEAIDWPLRLTWYRAAPDVQLVAGQRWQMRLRVRPAHGHRNPGLDDSEWRDWRDEIAGVGYVRDRDLQPRLLAHDAAGVWLSWRNALRQRLLQADLWPTARPWLLALVLGDLTRLTADDWQVLQVTGTAHLLSVSGLHVTVWAGLAWALTAFAWGLAVRGRWTWPVLLPRSRVAAWVGVICALGYAALAGWQVPVQRSWLMLFTALMLRQVAARWPAGLVVLAAAVVVTVWDPWSIRQAGFWLSFGAVLALVAVVDEHTRGWVNKAKALWATQWRVGWVLMPLLAWWLGQLSWLGFVVNLVAIPWVTLVVMPLALLGLVWPLTWSLAAWTLKPLVLGLPPLSAWAGGVWWVATPPGALALAAALGLWWAMKPWSLSWRALGWVWILPALMWRDPPPRPGHFSLLAWDIGQGSAVLVRTAQHSLLYDTGPSFNDSGDAASRWLVPGLRRAGIQLDGLLLSHEDNDHVGGTKSVLAANPEAQVWAPFSLPDRPTQPCVAGTSWVWDGVRFEILHPAALPSGRAGNADSCVLRVAQAQASVLLTGDIGVAQEAALLAGRSDWRTTVLLAAHHGSKTSSSAAWLETLKPQWVWIQAGYANRYGHPSPEVVQRLDALGLRWQNTADCGALSWSSEAQLQSRCERVAAPRYWALAPK